MKKAITKVFVGALIFCLTIQNISAMEHNVTHLKKLIENVIDPAIKQDKISSDYYQFIFQEVDTLLFDLSSQFPQQVNVIYNQPLFSNLRTAPPSPANLTKLKTVLEIFLEGVTPPETAPMAQKTQNVDDLENLIQHINNTIFIMDKDPNNPYSVPHQTYSHIFDKYGTVLQQFYGDFPKYIDNIYKLFSISELSRQRNSAANLRQLNLALNNVLQHVTTHQPEK